MSTFRRTAFVAAMILLGAALVSSVNGAEVPRLVHFQGRLTEASTGTPREGNFTLTFKVYDVQTGGTALWTETQTGVQTNDKGIFSLMLGGVTALNLSFDRQYWLGLQVNSEAEMSPRYQLAAAPYALRAKTSENADTATNATNATNAVNATYANTATALQGRAVASTAPAEGQVLKWSSANTRWEPAADATGGSGGGGDVTDVLAGAGISVANSGGPQPTVSVNFAGSGSANTASRSDHAHTGMGDVTAVSAGTGLTGGGTSGDLTLSVNFAGNGSAGTASRSDHNHDSAYAAASHNHDGSYSAIAHNHDSSYVKKTGDAMTGNLTVPGLVVGSGADPSYPVLMQRFFADNSSANTQVAKTNDLVLRTVGNSNDFRLVNTGTSTREYVWCKGSDWANATAATLNGGASVTLSAGSDCYFYIMFGAAYSGIHVTEVRAFRRAGDYYWVGFMTSTVNQ